MGIIMKKILMALAVVAGLLFSLTPALADSVTFNDLVGNFGQVYDVTVDWDGTDTIKYTFTVDESTVTGPPVGQLHITAVAFALPTGVTGIQGTDPPNFTVTNSGTAVPPADTGSTSYFFAHYSNDGISASPFGNYDLLAGGSTGTPPPPRFTDDPPADRGISEGETFTYGFKLTGTHLTTLTLADFLAATSTIGEPFAAVRWRDSVADYSDKTLVLVPLPGALLLLGAGLARLAAYSRRRRLQG
jgi:hypothetical protein